MAACASGFLLCWYSVIRQPEPNPIEKLTRPEKS
jgi:hypothetical protein